MRVRFWGTRGSIAKPGPTTVRYGGNTSCVEVAANDGTLVILDCGTGAHGLGQALMAARSGPLHGHILIGHTHWDHIQGFPFFAPLFVPGNEWDIYAPGGLSKHLQDTLAGQMDYTYFPVSLTQLGATLRYHDLVEGTFSLGGITVSAQYLNHPALTLGYRLTADGASIVYATDHEPHSQVSAMPSGGAQLPSFPHQEDQRHAAFLHGADLLIHDTQYTAAEYPQRHGWGHSTVEYVVDMALAAETKQLALFHHDPLRTDEAVDQLVLAARARANAAAGRLDVFGAAEGQVLDLTGALAANQFSRPMPSDRTFDARGRAALLAVADSEAARILQEAVQAEGMVPRVVPPGAFDVALEREQPALVFLDEASELPAVLSDVPLIRILAKEEARSCGAQPGISDCLASPFSSAYIRSRMRAWLLRSQPRWTAAPLPSDEERRLAHVQTLQLLDTPSELRFERFARLAERAFDVPVALLSLIDRDRQWVKTPSPLLDHEFARDVSICAHALLREGPLVISDGASDPTYGDNPAFTELNFRFYAGVALEDAEGVKVGTLCLLDYEPRIFSALDQAMLGDLAELASRELGERTARMQTSAPKSLG